MAAFIYDGLVYLHVLSVILSIGPYFVLLTMIARMKKKSTEPDHTQMQSFIQIFRGVVRLTKHAGHLLVVTGVLLILVGGWNWTVPWLLLSIIILMSALFFIMRAFSPILAKLEDGEGATEKEALLGRLTRSVWMYIAIMLLVMWLMVAKPVL